MKASEYIEKIRELIEKHGDVEVLADGEFHLETARGPVWGAERHHPDFPPDVPHLYMR